ncbi:MAG: YbjQ family protein [Synergistaceae bacterium]|jgi:uncharacterized protein YbjQ (UPF0145 family)|nr:YbjQ family protein [Synergistaceae bacterium]
MDLPPWEQEEQDKWKRQYGDRPRPSVAVDSPKRRDSKILVTTTETIGGKKFINLGLVQGSVVYAGNIVTDAQNLFAGSPCGELPGATGMIAEARRIAVDRMLDEARELKADAIVGVRFSSSEIMQTVVEFLVYGAAVTYMNA